MITLNEELNHLVGVHSIKHLAEEEVLVAQIDSTIMEGISHIFRLAITIVNPMDRSLASKRNSNPMGRVSTFRTKQIGTQITS